MDVDDLLRRVGEVQASPTSNTLLDRLKSINDALGGSGLSQYVDGLEALVTSTNSLITTMNTYVDGLEGLLTSAQSVARLLSATGTSGDATNVKASAATLYGIKGYNASSSVRYLKLYNSASAPTAGVGTPRHTFALPPLSGFAFDFPQGIAYSAGLGFTLVTTSPDAGAVGVTAADIVGLNIEYT